MKKTLILFAVILFSFTGYSQQSITNDISVIIKSFNTLSIGKKLDIDQDFLDKHIRNIPGTAEINLLIKEYDKNGKWLNDGLVISEDLKPFINVKGETLIFKSKMNAEMETASFILNFKAIINKTEADQP